MTFDNVGIQPGWHCLDLGCGAMGILGPLSRRVGPAGLVTGVDRDAQQLAAARAYVADDGLSNVKIIEADAFASALPNSHLISPMHASSSAQWGRQTRYCRKWYA